MTKTLGDEMRDELQHQQWLIENGKLYYAMKQRAEAAEAERDAALERERVELIEWAARVDEQFKLRQQATAERDEARRKLEQAQSDLKEYREEIERMTRKAMTS